MAMRGAGQYAPGKAHKLNKSVGSFSPSFIKVAAEQTPAELALEAEFGEKRWVWVKDEKNGYLKAWVVRDEGDLLHVRCTDDTDKTVKATETDKVNPPKFDRVSDMASLTYLNEPSVAFNLQARFQADAIYTYSGLFLVAVNPYKRLSIYNQDSIDLYKNQTRDDSKPHVFATSHTAYRNMAEMHENQAILVTGESGAGKTETTKKVIQFLAAIAQSPADQRRHDGNLEEQILRANPILEAFGNAQTVRNDNSSRFGKFIRIHFNEHGYISGANINWFLLEKSRVTQQASGERNYHIFYQLLAGASQSLKDELLLTGSVQDYAYLKHGRAAIPGVSDKYMFEELLGSFKVMGITEHEQKQYFKTIAAILHIGNLTVAADRADQARLVDMTQAEKLSHLLGIPVKEFTKALLTPRVKAGREIVTQARTAAQVEASLAALARALYERTFGALVDRLNQALCSSDGLLAHDQFIGVLDMAGFEIFKHNSFEQLCINFTNEKLQQFFNHHMFVLEQEEYAREQIAWKFVDFGLDLQPTIELIEKSNPIGILSCLDEECVMPKASNKTFTEKLHQLWSKESNKYRPSKFAGDGFVLTHYAADVEYNTTGWLEKNKDPLNENVSVLLAASSDTFLAALFEDSGESKGRVKKGLFRTVAQRHKEQLAALMTQLNATQPHFIRCIIPNHEKSPRLFDFGLVLDQLRCNGVLEGIRIARTGFPNRLPFSEFRQRYGILGPVMPEGFIEGAKASQKILEALALDTSYYKIGLSKVFFRAGVLADLEESREAAMKALVAQIQCRARGYAVRRLTNKRLQRKGASELLKKDFRTYLKMAESPWWQLFIKMKPVLTATRSDREMRMRSQEIVKLEALAKEKEIASQKAMESMRQAEAARRELEEALAAERLTAVDKDALYERSRARETALQEELDIAMEDVDALEARCDQLMQVKAELEAQMEGLRGDFDQGAVMTERLLNEKLALQKRFEELEASLQVSASMKDELEEARLSKELAVKDLQSKIASNDLVIEKLGHDHQMTLQDLEGKLKKSTSVQAQLKRDLEAAQLSKKAAQQQLDELVQSVAANEVLLGKKDKELTELARMAREKSTEHDKALAELSTERIQRTSLSDTVANLQSELASLGNAKNAIEEELAVLKRNSSKTEEVKALETKLASAHSELESFKASEKKQGLEHRRTLESKARESETHRLAVQRLEVINANLVKQMAKSRQELLEKEKALGTLQDSKDALGLQRDQLQARLQGIDVASTAVDQVKVALQRELHEAQQLARTSQAKAAQVDVEKERYRREVLDVKAKLEQLVLERKSREVQLQKHTTQHASLAARLQEAERERDAVKSNLTQKQAKLDRLDRMDETLVATQVRDALREKEVAETALAKVKTQLDAVENELVALNGRKTRFDKELADLTLELEREHQLAKSAERMNAKLQSQLTDSRTQLEGERQAKAAAQLQVRQLNSALETANGDLKERTDQVMSLYRAVSKTDEVPTDWAGYKAKIATSVDLAKQLHEAVQAHKRSEASRQALEQQLANVKKSHSDIEEFDKKRSLTRLQANVASLDVQALPNRPSSAPWTPPSQGTLSPSRSRTNTLARNFENVEPPRMGGTYPSEGTRKLQSELEALRRQLAALEAEKRQLLRKTPQGEPLDPIAFAKLQRENKRLHELLDDNADQLDAMADSQRNDRAFLKDLQTKSMQEIESTFATLADERVTMTQAQKKTMSELQTAKQSMEALTTSKKQLSRTVEALKLDLEQQIALREQEASVATQLENELNDLALKHETEASRSKELEDSVRVFRQRAEEYYSRLEQAEVTVMKASRAEQFARKQWQETEEALKAALHDRTSQDAFIANLQKQVAELDEKLEDHQLELAEASAHRSRLQQEVTQHRTARSAELEERDVSAEQTRKAYGRELSALSAELETERMSGLRLIEDNKAIRSQLEELQAKASEDALDAASLAKEKQRMENKLGDLTKAYDESSAAQRDAQNRLVNMLSELRSLRAAKDDAESEAKQLSNDKKLLERRLNDLQQELQNAKSDTRPALRDQAAELAQKEDLLSRLTERVQRADTAALEAQREVGQARDANVKLHRQKAALENEKKELQLKLVDLETRSFTSAPSDRAFLTKRIQELEEELSRQAMAKSEESRSLRSTDRNIKELEAMLQRKASTEQLLSQQAAKAEAKMQALQQDLESSRDSDAAHQLRAKRAEREATDQRERALRAEKELERLRSRAEAAKNLTRQSTLATGGPGARLSIGNRSMLDAKR
ncbi:P-loop containing nucleoside triphosphate hydrolase protein [Protomyces lactucae-debilis]|uniref:p-loop containing nucleoside triphosphate hydrolase protein n=1 Tax=Protomyces lactucae-debilis TaxID=2754530 RepID=A0A1Y2FH39_PROLT|nr:P-loop containing nucleoside triphosphate hydrolase protein [Protomyces lactucae-debilis]ORY83268.1 P-loop containing nucleoside triphosphate hydrolase protein [Protomyces lactucae-debilis]